MVINRVRSSFRKRAVATVLATPAVATARSAAVQTPMAQVAALPELPDFEALAPPLPASQKDAGGDALEDYFDRLDAAFANIGSPPGADRSATPPEDLSSGIGELNRPPLARAPLTEESPHAWEFRPAATSARAPAPSCQRVRGAAAAKNDIPPLPPAAAFGAAPRPRR